jgi:hypothetical protein
MSTPILVVKVGIERSLHHEFTDCVRWVGNLVMSKAGNGDEERAKHERYTLPPNKILLWDPEELEAPDPLEHGHREVISPFTYVLNLS